MSNLLKLSLTYRYESSERFLKNLFCTMVKPIAAWKVLKAYFNMFNGSVNCKCIVYSHGFLNNSCCIRLKDYDDFI